MNANQTTDTTLHGRWLLAARVAWVGLTVLVVVLWSIGNTVIIREPLPDCAEVTCDPVDFNAGDLELAREQGLPTFGGPLGGLRALAIVPGVLYFLVAGLIFWRRSRDWMALLVSFALVFIGGLLFTSGNDALARTYPALDPAQGLASAVGAACMALIFYLFPDGRFVPGWTLWVVIVVAVLVTLSEFIPVSGDVAELIVFIPINIILITGVFAQVYRYLRVSGPLERQQTKWVVIGLFGAVGLMVTWLFVALAFPPDEPSVGRIYALLVAGPVISVLIFLLPLGFAVAILRYRLWDIGVFVNRAMVYGLLTAILVGGYVGLVVGLQTAFRAVTDQGSAVAVVISTLAIAALFQPLRRRIQDFIDRRFYRSRYDAAQTLAAFSERMRDEVDLDKLAGELVTVVEDTMQPAHVSLWLRKAEARTPRSKP